MQGEIGKPTTKSVGTCILTAEKKVKLVESGEESFVCF